MPALLAGMLLLCGGIARAQGGLSPLAFDIVSSTCVLPNGKITVHANYGTGPYQFTIMDPSSGFTQTATEATNVHTFTNLSGLPIVGKQYNFQVLDGTGSPATDFTLLSDLSVNITANATPTGCADTSGTIEIVVSYGGAPFQYSIDDGTHVTAGASPTFTGLATGNYTASIKDNNGCTATTPVVVPLMNDLSVVIGPPPPICEGDSVQLPVLSHADTYSWTHPESLSDPTVAAPWATPSINTTYTVTVTSGPAGLCAPKSASVTVTVNPSPVANAGPDVATCSGKNVILHGTGAGAGGKYNWSPSTYLISPTVPSPAVLRPTESISYALSVTAADGCVSRVADTVHVTVIPSFQVNAGPDTIVYMGEPAQLHATVPDSLGTVTYQWTPYLGLDNPTVADPTVVLNGPDEVQYIVEATTAGGCSGTDTVNVKVFGVADLFVPSAFTPNNDGHNDVLRVIGPGVKLAVFAVYDRWGRQVFLTKNASVGWDGTLNGRALDQGTYVWMAEAVDIHGKVIQKKGTVVLIR